MFSLKRLFQKASRYAGMLGLALILSGCFETKETFVLNPDGSGKVVHESTFARSGMGLINQDDRASLEEQMQTAIKGLMEEATGVEAWREVSYRRLPDGRLYFKGTAYFKDLSALNFPNLTALAFKVEKTAAGGLAVQVDGSANKDEKEPRTLPGNWTEEELSQRVLRGRSSYQEMRPLLAGWATTLKQEVTLQFPGEIESLSNFNKVDARTVSLNYGGTRVLAVFDEVTSSDAWWRRQVKAGINIPNGSTAFEDDETNAKLFGEAAPVRVAVSAKAAPQFDYAAEVAVAKKETAALKEKLGVKSEGKMPRKLTAADAAPAAPGKAGEMLENLEVAGAKYVYDDKSGRLPFSSRRGLTLMLRGDLPFEILQATTGAVLTATADDGSSLLLSESKIELNGFSVQGETISFEAEIALPAATAKTLGEVSGYIECVAAGVTRTTDFGFGEWKTGAKGKEFGATLASFEQPKGDRRGGFELKVDLPSWQVKEIQVVDAAGQKLDVRSGSSSSSGSHSQYEFSFDKPLGAKARLQAEIYDPLQKVRVPFKIKNLPLRGQP